MSHLSIVCLGRCVFHVPLCMQIHTTRAWSWETHVSHMFHSFTPIFLSCFLTTIGFSFYIIITSLLNNHWSFPNICFSLCRELSLARYTYTVNHSQHSSEVAPYASHSTSAHSSRLGLYMLHHCDKYPAYLWGLSTWSVNGSTYNNGAKGIAGNHRGPVRIPLAQSHRCWCLLVKQLPRPFWILFLYSKFFSNI